MGMRKLEGKTAPLRSSRRARGASETQKKPLPRACGTGASKRGLDRSGKAAQGLIAPASRSCVCNSSIFASSVPM